MGTEVTDGLLNMVDMAFRAYDPCFSEDRHSLPGAILLEVNFRDKMGNIIHSVRRD